MSVVESLWYVRSLDKFLSPSEATQNEILTTLRNVLLLKSSPEVGRESYSRANNVVEKVECVVCECLSFVFWKGDTLKFQIGERY